MADIDADLVTALKQAKGKKMFFALVPKGADGKLIVAKKKILPKEIAEAKKEIGGSTPVTGKCFGENGTMVFLVAKPAAPTLASLVKKLAKREAGLTIDPEFRLAADADAEEPEGGAEAAAVGGAPAPPSKATPPPKAKLNLGPWQAARQEVISGLKDLAKKVVGTKHGSAAAVLKELNYIMAKLPASPAADELDKLEAFVRNDATITDAEDVPDHFHDLEIREPLLKALEALKQ